MPTVLSSDAEEDGGGDALDFECARGARRSLLLEVKECVVAFLETEGSVLHGLVSILDTQSVDASGRPQLLLGIDESTPARTRFAATKIGILVPDGVVGNRVADGVNTKLFRRPTVIECVPMHGRGVPFDPESQTRPAPVVHPLVPRGGSARFIDPYPEQSDRTYVVATALRWIRDFVQHDPPPPLPPPVAEDSDGAPLIQGCIVLIRGLTDRHEFNGRLATAVGKQRIRETDDSVREGVIGLLIGPRKGFYVDKGNLTVIPNVAALSQLVLDGVTTNEADFRRGAELMHLREAHLADILKQHGVTDPNASHPMAQAAPLPARKERERRRQIEKLEREAHEKRATAAAAALETDDEPSV